jgi:predicted MPP superfamily phosphohydrolase
MRIYLVVFIFLILTIYAPDYYLYRRIKIKYLQLFHWIPTLFFTFFFISIRFFAEWVKQEQHAHSFIWLFWLFTLIYIPKLIYVTFVALNAFICWLCKKKSNIIRYVGLSLAGIVVVSLLYGTFITRFDYRVHECIIESSKLPKEFDGYKIVQLSDIHLGSFNKNYNVIKDVAQLVNTQEPDIIVFTGDMVNNYASETKGWAPYFQLMKAKDGKFAIMGNHDYGDYSEWKNETEKLANLNGIKDAYCNFGFRLLLDEWIPLKKDSSTIALIGVENWGKPPFRKYGNLQKAKKGTENIAFKILLSHDPSHWDAEVVGKENITLTLSGHTHGAQLGFNRWGIQFSPSQWIFKQWDRLYKKGKQYIYVNRGIGYVGIPFRLGMPPEITVIILRKTIDD